MGLFSMIFGKGPKRAPAPKKRTVRRRANPMTGVSGVKVVGKGGYPRQAVGESNFQAALSRICGGHNRDGHELETFARLVPEPTNAFDPNAVMVVISDLKVGYLSRDDAKRYLDSLSAEGLGGAEAWVAATITGGWRTNQHDSGHFGVRLALPWPAKFER